MTAGAVLRAAHSCGAVADSHRLPVHSSPSGVYVRKYRVGGGRKANGPLASGQNDPNPPAQFRRPGIGFAAPDGQTARTETNPVFSVSHKQSDTDAIPSWSRDGEWIYFASNRTGQGQVWKAPANGGETVQFTKQGGTAAYASPDGQYLCYAKARGETSLWRVPVAGGHTQLDVGTRGINFLPRDRRSIRFFSLDERRREIAGQRRLLGSRHSEPPFKKLTPFQALLSRSRSSLSCCWLASETPRASRSSLCQQQRPEA